MNRSNQRRVLAVTLVVFATIGTAAALAGEVTAEQANENVAVKGQFVRLAANQEGWVTLGYRIANQSVGKDWMLLEVGMTIPGNGKEQKIRRDAVSLITPDKTVIPLPTQKEYSKANLRGLDLEANRVRDSINYFPAMADQACRIGFFTDTNSPSRGAAHDEVTLSKKRACMGRLYFPIPGGVALGLYNLDVRFGNSTVRVPFKIMTKDEAKAFKKEWKAAEKAAKKKK